MTHHSNRSCLSHAGRFAAAWLAGASLASAAYVSDPAPSITWNSATQVTFFKDLNGFSHYGALDHAVDLLNTGNSATWNFDVTAAGVDPANVVAFSLSFSVSLDTTALNPQDYYLDLETPISGGAVYPGIVFNHGVPATGPFNNWTTVSPYCSFTPGTFPSVLAVSGSANMLAPATGANDWIAIDSVTLTVTLAPPPPPTLYLAPATPGWATIWWAPATPGFTLQSSDSLSAPNWVNEPSGTNNPATVDATASARFYRLVKAN